MSQILYFKEVLIKNKPVRVKPVSEDNDEIITEDIEDVED